MLEGFIISISVKHNLAMILLHIEQYRIFGFYMSNGFLSFSLLHCLNNSACGFSAFQQARCFLDHVRFKGDSAAKVLLEYMQQKQNSGSNPNQKTQTLSQGRQI